MFKLTDIITGLTLLAAPVCAAQTLIADYDIIPRPRQIAADDGAKPYILRDGVRVSVADESLRPDAGRLSQLLSTVSGIDTGDNSGAGITLALDSVSLPREGYRMKISDNGVTITGGSGAAVMYGVNTLVKSLPAGTDATSISLPAVEICDAPRFPYRGAHFDVSRHFFPADSVRKFIDILALHNINNFHWHLTDDQGWRIESKVFPRLTEVGSWRSGTVIGNNSGRYDSIPHGGFYTQDELRDIVGYAAERHINVIPEVDMPGHMLAALSAYPELGCTGGPYEIWQMWGVSDDVLCAGNPEVYSFIDTLLDELCTIFPSPMIHIGGDECPKVRWKECPRCQAAAAALDVPEGTDPYEALQAKFMSHAVRHLAGHGRRVIGWDEILEGGIADSTTIIQSWRGMGGAGEAACRGMDTFLSPTSHLYFDYYQSERTDLEPLAFNGYVPLKTVYEFEPVPVGLTPEQEKHIIGLQPNLWTEYVTTFRQAQYMELPRLAAAAEVGWTPREAPRDFDRFEKRLNRMFDTYDALGYNHAEHIREVKIHSSQTEDGGIQIVLSTIDDAPILYTTDGSDPAISGKPYTGPLTLSSDMRLRAVACRDGRYTQGIDEKVEFNKATGRTVTLLTEPVDRFTYDGAKLLTDGRRGGRLFTTGRWIGYYNKPMEAVIDLDKPTEISSFAFNTDVLYGFWIFDAVGAKVWTSEDGENFTLVAEEEYPEATERRPDFIGTHTLKFAPHKARYVKVRIYTQDTIPAWHPGAGRPGFMFVDEFMIN